ncbi:MAG: hypothetical protein UX80_C0015G0009 [Candidatus Amesbacteria bacterium GW2011_GWA2_47_11b]|uniref:DUF2188 domain-containing protein n=1 Tax=Candidatus Amesbacteria bacterium GW2011_GWA2_47_11b TaxID=1618358 RepID=A0A0G1UIE4_9BACT|nr:MAG: hypothetical protein UX80_C0015G0009 [Candidatus Amesbacteria bacterium GW2011_GWA2_47_11b]
MSKNNYWVSPSEEGWKAKREGAERAAGVFDSQKEAENFARNILQSRGGELITQNRQGEIRSKDTINSFDQCPPRDREN